MEKWRFGYLKDNNVQSTKWYDYDDKQSNISDLKQVLFV